MRRIFGGCGETKWAAGWQLFILKRAPALFHPRSLTECVRAQEHEVSNLTSIRAEGNGTHLATVKATTAEHSRHITDGGTGGPSPDVMSQLREAPRDTT